MKPLTPKLLYILPEWNGNTDTHYAHLYDFLKELSRRIPIFLVIEKGTLPSASFEFQKVRLLRTHSPLLRFFELTGVLTMARIRGYRVFYTHYSLIGGFTAAIVTRLTKAKSLYWHSGLVWEYKRPWYEEWILRSVFRFSHFLVTGSERMKQDYHENYTIPLSKIIVFQKSISPERFKPDTEKVKELREKLKIPVNTPVILFLHRLSKRKGAQYLPDIVERFRNQNVIFLIGGEGPERENLEFRIQDLGLENKVMILGKIPNREVPNYFALATVFLMPSDEEGEPRVLLEAMMMGAPFVATDVGGVREIVPEAAQEFIVPRGNIDAIADKLEQLLKDAELRQKLAREGKKFVEQFSTEKVAERFAKLVHTIS